MIWNKIYIKRPKPFTLENASWAQISEAAQSGEAQNYWAIGDTKSVRIQGTVGINTYNGIYYVYIIGFDHQGQKGITFQGFKTADGIDISLVDAKYAQQSSGGTKCFNINHASRRNYGGWAACDLRYDILGSTDREPDNYRATKTVGCKGYDASETTALSPVEDTLMAALPEELRKCMKPITVYTDNVGGKASASENITATVDYLPLLAEFEVLGTSAQTCQYEKNSQKRYAYYAAGKPALKYKDSDTGSASSWLLRSPCVKYDDGCCLVGQSGNDSNSYCYSSFGLAPIFRV